MPQAPVQPPRRRFRSKTPEGGNSSSGSGWGPITRHQISGFFFQIRRIANAVALGDTRMLADPLRRQGRALGVGLLLGLVACGGAFVYSVLRPAGVPAGNSILSDRATGARYVKVNDTLHPVLNLASARLIVGKPDNPSPVKSDELDKMQHGPTLGIYNAPDRMVQNPSRDARWIVCDAVAGPDVGTTVIAGDPAAGPGHAASMSESSAVLATSDGGVTTWLIWGGKRSLINLNDPAVTASIGINVDTPGPRPINRQLLNLIPESPALIVPFIGNAGDPPRFPWPKEGPAPVVGSVVTDRVNEQLNYFAVTAEGLQPIPQTLAAMLRAQDAHGLVEPPALTPDQVAKAPTARVIPVENYPAKALKISDPGVEPVTCGQWVKLDGAPTSSLTLLVGQSLPIHPEDHPLALTAAGVGTATRVVMPTGSGYYVQVTGQEPKSGTKESSFWVSDLGWRYGIEVPQKNEAQSQDPEASLGRTGPALPIPWSVLNLLAPGPTLSKTDALVEH
ncbi:type VII secretion protein EccB, Actinobacterial [Mycobacteroides abscessus subsp. abscessus]|nr:type VII secretion protein EccB, Actinobacterial [Mycobacteroides abscessus subsp. abscessus]SLH38697.1 type VII secretion protein EccB, Actinobacterial [Mycobacteroides abscessus subsp. abscessus]